MCWKMLGKSLILGCGYTLFHIWEMQESFSYFGNFCWIYDRNIENNIWHRILKKMDYCTSPILLFPTPRLPHNGRKYDTKIICGYIIRFLTLILEVLQYLPPAYMYPFRKIIYGYDFLPLCQQSWFLYWFVKLYLVLTTNSYCIISLTETSCLLPLLLLLIWLILFFLLKVSAALIT